jgi:hypothetical protein
METQKNGIIFLTHTPNQGLIDFAYEIEYTTELSVYIICDNNDYIPEKKYKKLIVKIDDNICEYNNFKNANFIIKKPITAWDKVLFFLCRQFKTLDFCWIVEDDVFIPSIKSILDLTDKNCKYDLVVSSDKSNIDQNREYWHWYRMPQYMEKSYYNSAIDIYLHPKKSWHKSMVCAMGISRKLLYLLNFYVLSYKELMFIEFMFNTIAHQGELNIKVLENFDTIKWRHDWTESNILEKPNNWFHPVKAFSKHSEYRESLQKMGLTSKVRSKKSRWSILLKSRTPRSIYANSK